LLSVELRQGVQSIGDLCVFGPERLFLDHQRALEEWFSFGRATERLVEHAQVAAPSRIERVLLAIGGRRHANILFGNGNRFREFPGLIGLKAALEDRL
jgi:hypothetical protein